MASRNVSLAMILAVIYGCFGAVWIFASDTIVDMLVQDRQMLTHVQMWKGGAFVAVSATLIYLAAHNLLRALADSERRYRHLFADSPEALVLYDPDTLQVAEINAAGARLFGFDGAETKGAVITDLMDGGSKAAFLKDLPRLCAGETEAGLWRMRNRDGRILDVSSHGHNVIVKGRPLRLVQLVDVTARSRAEFELMRTLEQAAATNERMRSLGRALSHDVREPLRQVSGFVQLLSRRYRGRLDDEADLFINYVVEGVQRLKDVINDVELFSQTVVAEPVLVPVEKVIGEVLDVLRTPIESSGAIVETGHLPIVLADPGKLAVVFHALLDNAIKFNAPGRQPQIKVDGAALDSSWLLRVRDNGLGIAPEFRESVFSLFSRLHSRAHIPGNGTGLALARKLIEAQGGRIWIEDGVDGGVTVCISLPRTMNGEALVEEMQTVEEPAQH